MTIKHKHCQVANKYCLALMLLAGIWMGAAVAQGAETGIEGLKTQQEASAGTSLTTPSASKKQFNGVDWSGQQFWLVGMPDMLDRGAVTAEWRNLLARFPRQMENRTILPRRQDRTADAHEEPVVRYQLFIANFPEKRIAEEFCAMLRADQQRCSVVSSQSITLGNVSNATSAADTLGSNQDAQAASETEAEKEARQEAEAKAAKIKAKEEVKAEAERLKAEKKAKAEAEKQAAAEAKAEAARVKAEQKAKAEAEKQAAVEAKAEAARIKAEQKAQAEAEKQAAAEAKRAAEVEAVRVKAEQKAQAEAEAKAAAEEKARQAADARVAKLKAKIEAQAEAERLKAEQKAKAEAEKQAAAEAKAEAERLKAEQKAKAEAENQAAVEAKAEAARIKAEQKAQAEAEKHAAAEAKRATEAEAAHVKAGQKAQAAVETEVTRLKAGQEAQEATARMDAEKKAKAEELAAAETKQSTEAEAARQKVEQKPRAGAQAVAETKTAKQKPAQSDMLVDFSQKALLKNPDVLARWHNFQAATSETTAAQGGYFPRFDVSVDSGREHGQSQVDNYGVNTKNITFTLTQMLYDGFATRNEVRRLNNAQLTRYYELLDASENAALEAVRAFYDVSRQRKLFELTENNYVRHRTAYEQIKLKVAAGVGRRVDLEQATGRLALSESNLTVDNANVHDTSARFQRVIGELPPANLRKSPSQSKLAKQILPNAAAAVLSVAVDYHPAILAAVENVRSARYDLYGRWAKYQPTVNLSVSQNHGKNLGGVDGFTSNAAAKVTLNWNLFSGGSDSARSSQYAERLNAARDLRDKACRDIRMTLAIAYNDIWKLQEQLNYLDQHQLSIEKARTAYQKQFDIGQRTLLDLLDTENELYQAKRSYVNAEYDLAIAHVRTLAGMGRLASSLGITHLETADLPELLGTSSDAAENCPPEAPLALDIRKAELDARAVEEAKAAAEAAHVKEEDGKQEKVKEDEKFLMTPGEAKAAELRAKQGAKAPLAEPARLKAEQETQAAAEGKTKPKAEIKAKGEAGAARRP